MVDQCTSYLLFLLLEVLDLHPVLLELDLFHHLVVPVDCTVLVLVVLEVPDNTVLALVQELVPLSTLIFTPEVLEALEQVCMALVQEVLVLLEVLVVPEVLVDSCSTESSFPPEVLTV